MKMDFLKVFGCVSLLSLSFGAAAAVPEATDNGVPLNAQPGESVVNNSYFTESIRYNNLAKLAFADGDYDASFKYSMESIRIARSSDGYVTTQLKIAEAKKKIAEAKKRLAWAARAQAETYFPKEYGSAKDYYNAALNARDNEQWDDALNNAINTIDALANVSAPPPPAKTATVAAAPANNNGNGEKAPLPAQYTVRSWDTFGDCFWNISGRSWVYNDPFRWPILYRANKHKLKDPKNPNLIEPGMIIDIPSIRGEVRQGMWDAGKKYSPLR